MPTSMFPVMIMAMDTTAYMSRKNSRFKSHPAMAVPRTEDSGTW